MIGINIILNEREYAQNLLATGKMGSKPSADLWILAKYYGSSGAKEDEISKNLHQFMKEHTGDFNPVRWNAAIEKISRKVKKYPPQVLGCRG